MPDPQGTTLIELEIVSFNADDKDYEGYKFSITAKMSELWIVFLNWFIQEVLAYGMGLIPPSSGEVLLKLKDRVTDVEKLFTQSETEGQPSLKIDLSLIKPIIIMPRSSHSTDFLELDILHINIRRTSEWYGGSKDELGAVRLETMTLEIEDLHLVVGVRGQTGEGIIQEVNGFSLVLRELLRDLWHQVPAADLSIKIEELKAALSDKEYQVITECAIRNMAETPNSPPLLFPSKEEATDKINKEKQIVEEESPPPRQLSSDSNVVTNGVHGWSTEEMVPEISGSSANTAASLASKNIHTTVKIGIGIDLVQLSLFVGGSQDNTLASIQGLSSGRSYEKVARFKLIWWDKGSGSRDGVSMWRPIVPPGCAMLGDLAVQGFRSRDSRPMQAEKHGGVSFWYPVAPPCYVAMGCITSKSSVPEPDGANCVCCVCNELVTRVNFTAHSIWDSSTLHYGNEELSIWPVENEVIVGHGDVHTVLHSSGLLPKWYCTFTMLELHVITCS